MKFMNKSSVNDIMSPSIATARHLYVLLNQSQPDIHLMLYMLAAGLCKETELKSETSLKIQRVTLGTIAPTLGLFVLI